MGLPIFSTSTSKMRFTHSVSEKVKIATVTHNITDKVIYTEPEIDELQQSIFNQFKKGYNVQQVINILLAGSMDSDTAFTIALTAPIFVKVDKINKKLLIFMMPKLIESPLLGKIMVNLLVSEKWINPVK